MRIYFIFIVALFLVIGSIAAQAQDILPPMNNPPMAPLGQTSDESFRTRLPLSTRNAYMGDTLILQYQISLLSELVRREAQILRLKGSYDTMNIRFNVPAPPRGICSELPRNAPCEKAFPTLYNEAQPLQKPTPISNILEGVPVDEEIQLIQDEARRFFDERARVQEDIIDENVSTSTSESKPLKVSPVKPAEPTSDFEWVDVTCVAGACSATLVDTENQGERFLVKTGMTLPDDSTVHNIAYRVVEISKQGKIIKLIAAPSSTQGGPQSVRDTILNGPTDPDALDTSNTSLSNRSDRDLFNQARSLN